MGYVPSTKIWTESGGMLKKATIISLSDFMLMLNEDILIIDVRNTVEFKAGHINGAINIFVGTLLDNLDKINKNKKVVIYCQGGDRTTIAYSLLIKNGYTNVLNYFAGMNEWAEQGCPIVL